MKSEALLGLVVDHLKDTLPGLALLWLRPGWQSTDHSALHLRWDFPTGGGFSMTIGFDVEQRGARPQPTLVPKVRLSASIGAQVGEADIFVQVLAQAHDAGRRALALMSIHDVEP